MHGALWIMFMCFAAYVCIEEQRDKAEIKYFNPKYIRDARLVTKRLKPGGPFLTNITTILKVPWYNNITTEIAYKTSSSPRTVFKIKACEGLRHRWIRVFFEYYHGKKLTCPVPAGKYFMKNMELPPKNFPVPLPKGICRINFTTIEDGSKEVILFIAGKFYVNK